MKLFQLTVRLVLPAIAVLSMGSATASTLVPGVAVGSAGSTDDSIAIIGSGSSLTDAIEYFIPLRDGTNGTYGVTPVLECGSPPASSGTAGQCVDVGSGSGYNDASALQMNIFFDLAGLAASQAASLTFEFDDLDLTPNNDPDGFFESVLLSYWNWNGSAFDASPVALSSVIKSESAASNIESSPGDPNLITWNLDLLALAALNASAQAQGGFWIQLGFGSNFCKSYEDPDADPSVCSKHGQNTPEYLAAQLHVSPVPIPSAVWLFGSALIGFIGLSRRTRV